MSAYLMTDRDIKEKIRLEEMGIFADREAEITQTMNMLTQLGYNPVLKCWANGHIQVKSKMGVKWNYYAHSGTIVGFHYKKIGLSELIKLLDDK